jgi:CrcB protein
VRSFLLVALGGTIGTLARYGIGEWLDAGGSIPLGTLAVNVTGSFLLGALLASLAARSDDVGGGGRRRASRLLLGTGLLGGYTTYSALAVETEQLMRDGRVALGLAYALGSVVAGRAAPHAGLLAGRTTAR